MNARLKIWRSRFFLVSLLLYAFPATAWTQIQLNTNGNVALGVSSNDMYKLIVECSSGTNCGDGYPYITRQGIRAFAKAGYGNTGVYAEASGGGYLNYGVHGVASGATTNWAGYFTGNVYATGTYSSSDERLKRDIRSISPSEALQKVMRLSPMRYTFRDEEDLRQQGLPSLLAGDGEHLGLLADDIEAVFPEVVAEVGHIVGDVGEEVLVTTKAINYDELIPVLIAAIQELQNQVTILRNSQK